MGHVLNLSEDVVNGLVNLLFNFNRYTQVSVRDRSLLNTE